MTVERPRYPAGFSATNRKNRQAPQDPAQIGTVLNQIPSGIYIDTGLGSTANTIVRRNDEGFCLLRFRKLTRGRLPKHILGFSGI